FRLEEKIAAILSHEMIHADARHTGRALEFHLFLLGIVKAAEHFVVYLCVHLPYTKKIKVAQDKTRLIQERDEKAKAIRTIFERASSFLIQGITLCNSRSHELESDRFGMRLIRDAVRKTIGSSRSELTYDSPQAAIWLQEYFRKLPTRKNNFLRPVLNLFSTHPTPQERLEANQKTWDDLKQEIL
ncbi:MAG TPA: M48 family metalloprotease, partial [Rhabdochlamydiaceae bacterium]|nr:M48 family metalloprotease [Rhabdochlamydiaceae bacterium]